MKKNVKSLLLPLFTVILLPALLWFIWTRPFIQDALFEHFCHELLQEELAGDRLSLHYCLSNPESFQLDEMEAHLPIFDATSYEHAAERASRTLTRLHRIRCQSLNDTAQMTYQLLETSLYQDIAYGDYLYYDDLLSPANGLHSELLILLSEYRLQDKEDIVEYLALLEEVPLYLESLMIYDGKRRELGMYRGDSSTKEVIDQCDLMMNPCELENGSHFLLVTFTNRLHILLQSEIITEEEAASFVSENDRLVTTVLAPAYEKLGDGLMLSMYSLEPSEGLSTYPNGKEYYSLLFHTTTGSALTIEEIKTLLAEQFTKDCLALSAMLNTYPQELVNRYALLPLPDGQTRWDTAIMLDDLQMQMTDCFPTPPAVTYEIKNIDASMESYLAPAFYLIPPIDDYSENVIYLNPSNFSLSQAESGIPMTTDSSLPLLLSLYTTIAHEGFPGHLYQNVSLRASLPSTPNASDLLRTLFSYTGYTEGYATYAEMLSYDYAAAYFTAGRDSATKENVTAIIEMYRLDQSMRLCLLTLCDIAIHYDNASYEDILAMLQVYGIQDENSARAIYDYILNAPCNYPGYYIGYLEILRLKEAARNQWGDTYTELRFHEFLVKKGPADFATLNHCL